MPTLTPQVFVSGQLTVEDVTSFAEAGFSHVVNHRPDGEEPGQPLASDLAHAALEAGMVMVHAPVRGLPQPEAVEATRRVLDALGVNGKAVLFCRSGMRSVAAWAMAERLRGVEAGYLRAAAAAAGYDISGAPL